MNYYCSYTCEHLLKIRYLKKETIEEAQGNVAPKQDMSPALVKIAHIMFLFFDYCRQTLLEEEYNDSKKMTLISASTQPDDISEG